MLSAGRQVHHPQQPPGGGGGPGLHSHACSNRPGHLPLPQRVVPHHGRGCAAKPGRAAACPGAWDPVAILVSVGVGCDASAILAVLSWRNLDTTGHVSLGNRTGRLAIAMGLLFGPGFHGMQQSRASSQLLAFKAGQLCATHTAHHHHSTGLSSPDQAPRAQAGARICAGQSQLSGRH